MKLLRRISLQLGDLLAYVLLPGVAVLTPASFSRWLLRKATAWGWLLAEPSAAALEGAARHLAIGDTAAWQRRWKQVELLDVRDLYMMLFGRSRSVLAEIDCNLPIETAGDRVMVGMHYGPGLLVLKRLEASRLNPAFPYRPPEKALLRLRPFQYLYSTLTARFLDRTLGDRAVEVGGAGRVLRDLLDRPGSICVLMDAPPMQGRRLVRRRVLGADASFNTGFPAMLAKKGREYVLYAMNLNPDGSLRKALEMEGPFRPENTEEFLERYAGFLDRHLSSDSPLWRIWHAEHQFWN